MSGYVGLSQLKKQKLEVAGSSGAVQVLRMENDAPVVGPDAPTANSKMVKLDIAIAGCSRPTSCLRVIRPRPKSVTADEPLPCHRTPRTKEDFASVIGAPSCSE